MPKPRQPPGNGHDDSAYGGQKFDVEKSKISDDATAPELQLNRKGLGRCCLPSYVCRWTVPLQLLMLLHRC